MEVKEKVKEKYAEAACRVSAGKELSADCCSTTSQRVALVQQVKLSAWI
jgi:hypothetical protein